MSMIKFMINNSETYVKSLVALIEKNNYRTDTIFVFYQPAYRGELQDWWLCHNTTDNGSVKRTRQNRRRKGR